MGTLKPKGCEDVSPLSSSQARNGCQRIGSVSFMAQGAPSTPDSGYGSSTETPQKPSLLRPLTDSSDYIACSRLEGSIDEPLDSPQTVETASHLGLPLTLGVEELKRPKTWEMLPRRASCPKAWPEQESAGCSGVVQLRSPVADASPTKSNILKLSDRFIPFREPHAEIRDAFCIGMTPDRMTPGERLLRDEIASPDAFCSQQSRDRATVSSPATQRRSAVMMERRVRSFITSRSGISSQFVQSGTVLRPILQTAHEGRERQVSIGAVWGVGGLAPNGSAVDNGRPQELHGDTNAPLYQTSFSKKGPATEAAERDMRQHEARLAMALKLDRVQRVLKLSVQPSPYKECLQPSTATVLRCKTTWDGIQWAKEGSVSNLRRGSKTQTLITAPFRVLDAPNLRDDFYCSMLAYSPTSHTLVVALGNMLYLWSEQLGARLIDPGAHDNDWITSVAFSSAQGRKGILAYARSNSKMTLMSIRDGEDLPNNLTVAPRFEVNHPAPVTSLSWKPTYTIRPSQNPFDLIPSSARTEELLVGDYAGQIWYYSVEWPERWDYKSKDWRGEMTLLAVIRVHTQQICGLSWSPSGDLFATGGNDNVCFLFETGKIMQRRQRVLRRMELPDTLNYENICGRKRETVAPVALEVGQGLARHKWVHGAAVKAIAFCPWQQGLVATGGGSHDKCIHFFHTSTGAQLAGIDVSAQVTSLIWSTTRRQIVATFGYANPDHPYRMAVFSWPDCRQVAAIPWEGEHRALYAISYPSQPTYKPEQSNCRKRRSRNPTATDSCIAVAASDQVVKFYQVWPSCQTAGGKTNTLGGRDILEDLDSFDKESDIIR